MGGKKKEAKEKPLEKMTAIELREVAKEVPEIVGVSGMNKAELLSEIKKARGIEDQGKQQKGADMRALKQKIKLTKQQREKALQADDRKMVTIYRKRIARLKRKTRRAA